MAREKPGNLEKLDRRDLRLIAICIAIAAVSGFIGVRYYFKVFPDASIEFKVTKDSSQPVAEAFLAGLGLSTVEYRHAAVFDYDDDAKTFLERELGVEESNRVLDSTVRLWRWRHRWFQPLSAEEIEADITTKGELVGFQHQLAEEAAAKAPANPEAAGARKIAEEFLATAIARPVESLVFIEGNSSVKPNRTDHSFTWKAGGVDIRGADYRLRVGVAGSEIVSYDEYLHVPDAWTRDYQNLRSYNDVTGEIDAVFLLLTFLAMLVVFILRIQRGDVRWRVSILVGAITTVLFTLSQLNNIPSNLFDYDTKTSFSGFVIENLVGALAMGFLMGAILFLFTASAEPLYRASFPRRMSLTFLFSRRALRTKEFFIACLAGVTATFFFFAYENVFYLIAQSFGAWSPRDVPYSDLLSTAFPWMYVLFFGWFPAISEEFMSRMFSIPFFEGVFRSRVAAVVVSAFIWGFGHATYPNQPFFIRGLEVGLAGIVFGMLMLRFGIAATVICHFSVDALYTAFVMIRSPNPYFVVTGTLSAGIFGIVLVAISIAYLVRGGFIPIEATNAGEDAKPVPSPELDGSAPGLAGLPHDVMPAGPAGKGGTFDAGLPQPIPAHLSYRPMSTRRIATGVALAISLLLLKLLPIPGFGDWVSFDATRADATAAAREFLSANGLDVSSFESAASILDRTDSTASAFLIERFGPERAGEVWRDKVPTPLWRVRFYKPGEEEEFKLSVLPFPPSLSASGGLDASNEGTAPPAPSDSRRVIGFEHVLPEDAPGVSIEPAAALALATSFATRQGLDLSKGVLKEQTAKDEKARRDHTLAWEFPAVGTEAGDDDARIRYEFVVQGDSVGAWGRSVKLPEAWERTREESNALTFILRFMKIPFIASLAGFAVLLFIAKIRERSVPWKPAIRIGCIAAACAVVRTILLLDSRWADQYDTSIPGPAFSVLMVIAVFFAAVIFFAVWSVVTAAAGSIHTRAVTMFGRDARRTYAKDALIAGFIALAVRAGAPVLASAFGVLIPRGMMFDSVPFDMDLESTIPGISALTGAVTAAFLSAAIASGAIGILSIYFRKPPARLLLALLFVFAFLPAGAKRPEEFLVAGLSVAVLAAGFAIVVTQFLRDNPFAWLWSAWFMLATNAAIGLLAQEALLFRVQGALVLAVVIASTAWLLREASSAREAALARESALPGESVNQIDRPDGQSPGRPRLS